MKKLVFKRPLATHYYASIYDKFPMSKGACVNIYGALRATLVKIALSDHPELAALLGEDVRVYKKAKIIDRRTGLVMFTRIKEGDVDTKTHLGDYDPPKRGVPLRSVRTGQ